MDRQIGKYYITNICSLPSASLSYRNFFVTSSVQFMNFDT